MLLGKKPVEERVVVASQVGDVSVSVPSMIWFSVNDLPVR